MRINRFNESKVMSYPIDPERDANQFIKKFNIDLNKPTDTITRLRQLLISNINSLIDNNPTMTDEWDWYEVYNIDDNGRKSRSILITEAVSDFHAKIKAAIETGNIEISFVGFYEAKKLDVNQYSNSLESQIKEKEESIIKLRRTLSKLKNSI